MKKAVIIFSRVPIAGKTKTRLMPFLTGEECAMLHKAFIQDTYKVCAETDADILVFYTPEDKKHIMRELLPERIHTCEDVLFLPQDGKDLGERMENAFGIAFRLGYKKVLLIGTDIPQVTSSILEEAFENLDKNDVVIHPTVDGGYYLIGMTGEHSTIWHIEQYGTNTVIHNTLVQLKKAGLKTAVGKVCRDIDTPEDLCALYREQREKNPEDMSCTAQYMRGRIKDKLVQGGRDRKERYGQYKR